MTIGKWAVWFSPNKIPVEETAKLAQIVEGHGYDTLWYPEAMAYEAMALGGYHLSQTSKLNVASGIANIYGRDPTAAIQGHNSLNAPYGGRYMLGLGVSHIPIVEGARGHNYGKPLSAMRTYLEAMYAAPVQITVPKRRVVLAALGPKMLALSAEMADGALPYNVTPEHTARAREIVGPGKAIYVEQKICLTNDASVARDVAAEQLAMYLRLPNYRNCWLSLGFSEDELSGRGSDRFLDAMVAWGTEDAIRTRLQAHFDAGADQVAIQPFDPAGGASPHYDALAAFAPGT